MSMISVELGSVRVLRRGAPKTSDSKGLKPRQGSAGGEGEELALEAEMGMDQGPHGMGLSESRRPLDGATKSLTRPQPCQKNCQALVNETLEAAGSDLQKPKMRLPKGGTEHLASRLSHVPKS